MVFSSSEEEHVKHVASVLQRLRDNNLFSKASKRVLHSSSVEYLGYVVSSQGLKMNSSKVQQILNWPQPKNIKALQSFIGLANFYCRCIKHYSKKSLLSLSSLKKTRRSSSMRKLLANDSGKNPIALNSHKLLSDHYSLQYFTSSEVFTCCQARLADFLSEFHFSITYCPGRLDNLPYALSHWDDVYPERVVDFIIKNPQNFHQVLKQNEIKESRFLLALVDQIQKAIWQDKEYKEILKQLARGESVTDYSLEPQAKFLLFKDRLVIPRNHEPQLYIIQRRHDSQLAGQLRQKKTLKLTKRDYY
ncbi:hypothetical protein O181_124937 [Austropuccinia psidii MF-1]|uniref:Reverse transcriptase domain-containing protein n=1 Tax=Austropuccinia psidii MF-1 TaxID=1389203 RepID=A0A9Q3KQJ4_9BASI|nr:hypothetical protein [Austropuccinia psidii MF-1]